MTRKFIALLCVSLFGAVHAADGYVVKHGNTVLTADDVMQSIETQVPERSRAELIGNESKLRDFIAQVFAIRKLSEEAASREFSPAERWRIANAAERASAQVQLEHLIATGPTSDHEKAAREFYLANPAMFAIEEQVHAEHILISTASRSKEDALTRANEILKEVKTGSAAFGELAKLHSEDPSAKQNGGDLGFFARGRMVKPFEDAAFALNTPGEIAGPVESPFGYHLIRFVERKPASTKPFEAVKEQLIKDEALKFRRLRIVQEYERIGKLPGIEVDQESIKALVKPIDYNASRAAASGK